MIKCSAPYFDSGHQMVKEIFKAYTNTKSHRFTFDASHDLPQEVDLVISEPKQAAYIAWKFNHCIALEIVSKNESENEDKYEQHFDVIVPCENNYLSVLNVRNGCEKHPLGRTKAACDLGVNLVHLI